MSSLRDFYEVNLELARPGAPISFYEVEEGVVSAGHVLPPALIHGCDIENTLVGEGSVLKARSLFRVEHQMMHMMHDAPCSRHVPHPGLLMDNTLVGEGSVLKVILRIMHA